MNALMTDPVLAEYLGRFGALAPDPLCPEILAYNTLDYGGLCRHLRERDERAPVPFWAVVWPGGRGLARYILDNPREFKKKRVLDVGMGSGITSIAAATAGARVSGFDIDPCAAALAEKTAQANGVECRWSTDDPLAMGDEELAGYDLVLAGDMFYDEKFSSAFLRFLARASARGIGNIVADGGRTFRPRTGIRLLRSMRVPVFREIDGITARDVSVFTLVEG